MANACNLATRALLCFPTKMGLAHILTNKNCTVHTDRVPPELPIATIPTQYTIEHKIQ